MHAKAQQALLASLKLVKELKELIICEACTIFIPCVEALLIASPPTYEVVIPKDPQNPRDDYTASLIAYPSAAFNEWKLLKVNPNKTTTPVDAVTNLLESIYERADEETDGMQEGDTYNGETFES